MTSSAHEEDNKPHRALLRQSLRAGAECVTRKRRGDASPVHGTVLDASEQSQDISDTRGRDADGSSQGALLTMNRHQRAPATRKEAPLDVCVAFGRKSTTRESRPKALSFTAKHLVLLHRAASLNHREFANCSAPSLARPLGKKNAALRLRALANTQKPHSLKKLQRGNAPPPRASHTSPARCRDAAAPPSRDADAATPKLHRERFNRRLTRQTPQAFHSKEAVAPRRRFDGSTTYYTARGSTTVLSEKQRQDPDHGNSCGGERVVLRRR